MPLYHAVNANLPGTRIEDFYDVTLSPKYFKSLGKGLIIFDEVTKKALKSSAQFNQILSYLIIIFILLSLTISAILTNLILFENQKIILLLKIIGYKRLEIENYLIGGYLIATLLAIVCGIIFSLVIFGGTRKILTAKLGFSLYFLWSWQYILTFISLGLVFGLMVGFAMAFFIARQKPSDWHET
ncbi:FtsX-like permease family protein [Entomoplasma freundtii]|uniref:ABC3 transporter permease C-terminal domain-containing protein n=1 Tax=Entomoplasma freundtii TaxID=74700 RepID=A0A2K8NSB6_9MOLU|nr:FtsX-like permease family protein [Entomoplasma freundtii]ATZ16446.1 hypothetical protein EFREU_v1c04200 [Entomoplasma freundtii]TDY55976.1 FtsX-like permease family protein [Entomoplasma freundtii]